MHFPLHRVLLLSDIYLLASATCGLRATRDNRTAERERMEAVFAEERREQRRILENI